MRKLLFLIALIVGVITAQMLELNVTHAASNNYSKKVAVVIISDDADFKGKLFMKEMKHFGNKKSKVTILSGDEVQTKYQEYWLDEDEESLEEGTPTKEDLIDFVSYGGYNKVIYLMVNPSNVGHSSSTAMLPGQTLPGGLVTAPKLITTHSYSASVNVRSFLVDRDKVIKIANSTNSKVSGTALWTKKYAFQKCVKEISKILNPLL